MSQLEYFSPQTTSEGSHRASLIVWGIVFALLVPSIRYLVFPAFGTWVRSKTSGSQVE
jgi:hypothetical protein